MPAAFLVLLLLGALVPVRAGGPDVEAAASAAEKAAMIVGERVGAVAGAKYGAEAGKEAGAQVGRHVATEILGKEGDIMDPGFDPDNPAPPVGKAEYEDLKKKYPGTIAWFEKFDSNGDKHLGLGEFESAIMALIRNGILLPNFSIVGAWNTIPKNDAGLVNARSWVDFNGRTPAQSPGSQIPGESSGGKSTGDCLETDGKSLLSTCKQVFDHFDQDENGGLDDVEFALAFRGHVADDAIRDTFLTTPRNGPEVRGVKTVLYENFRPVCTSVTGMPADSLHVVVRVDELDPCTPNPCAGNTNKRTLCVPEPKRCLTEPCPQHSCVEPAADPDARIVDTYGRCIHEFTTFDTNKDHMIDLGEMGQGLAAAQKAGRLPAGFTADDIWPHFDKDTQGRIDLYEFVHFCIALSEDPDMNGSTAREECLDVAFLVFDEDKDHQISEREFFKNMRRAKREGHLPSNMNVRNVWDRLPKNKNGQADVGTIVEFCLSVSRGEAPEEAAAESDEFDSKGEEGDAEESTTESEQRRELEQLADVTWKEADFNQDGLISLSEFHAACSKALDESQCNASPDSGGGYDVIFTRFDKDGSNFLDKGEWRDLVVNKGLESKGGLSNAERERRLQLVGSAGSESGREAGAKAGAEAGEVAGKAAAEDMVTSGQSETPPSRIAP